MCLEEKRSSVILRLPFISRITVVRVAPRISVSTQEGSGIRGWTKREREKERGGGGEERRRLMQVASTVRIDGSLAAGCRRLNAETAVPTAVESAPKPGSGRRNGEGVKRLADD